GAVRGAELETVAVGALEVIAEDLLELGQPLAHLALQPVRVALVEGGPERLRHGVVRRVADQDVAEPEAVVAEELRTVRADELLPDERDQRRSEQRTRLRRQQLAQRAAVEAPALDRRALDHRPLVRLEPVDARGEERLERRRDDEVAAL